MTLLDKGLVGFCAFLMFAGALGHVVMPGFYAPLVPPPIPVSLANVVSIVVEGAIAVLLLWPRHRRTGAMAFTALMVLFLPLHVWDLTKEEPLVGSTTAAVIRLLVQVALIGVGGWLVRRLGRGVGAAG